MGLAFFAKPIITVAALLVLLLVCMQLTVSLRSQRDSFVYTNANSGTVDCSHLTPAAAALVPACGNGTAQISGDADIAGNAVITGDADITGNANVGGVVATNSVKLGKKFRLDANGDGQGFNDSWLRVLGTGENGPANDYYGGVAVGNLWSKGDVYLNQAGGNTNVKGTINMPNNGAGINWGNNYSHIYDTGDLHIDTDDTMHVSAPASLNVVTPTTDFTTPGSGQNIRLSSGWTGSTDAANGVNSEISNDVGNFKQLMIVGNRSAGGNRKVGIWDELTVNGPLKTPVGVEVTNGDPGPLIEKVYNGGNGDRYGVGQWPNGTTRLYAAGPYGPSTINLSFAHDGGGSFTDVVTVDQSNTVKINGKLCIGSTCITESDLQNIIGSAGAESVATNGLRFVTYSGYFNDDLSFFAKAPQGARGTSTDATNLTTMTNGNQHVNAGQLFSVEWTGNYLAKTTGSHAFWLYSDDAAYLWVGPTAAEGHNAGNAFVNAGGLHGMAGGGNQIQMTAGQYYPIRIQFGQNYGGCDCQFRFSLPQVNGQWAQMTNMTGYFFN